MGFSFNIGKAITRAVGISDHSVISKVVQAATLPISLPTNLALAGIQKVGGAVLGPSVGVQSIHDNAPQPVGAGNVLQPSAPTYTYYAGGGGYSPYQGGPQAWDYSTPLTTFSQPPLATYPAYFPAPQQPLDRTWEDLILGSSLFL